MGKLEPNWDLFWYQAKDPLPGPGALMKDFLPKTDAKKFCASEWLIYPLLEKFRWINAVESDQ